MERRKKFQDLYSRINKQKIPAFGSPDAEVNESKNLSDRFYFIFVLKEGPHSSLKEEEFFDALDQSLDRIDRESDSYQRLVSIDCFFLLLYIKFKMSNKDNDQMYINM